MEIGSTQLNKNLNLKPSIESETVEYAICIEEKAEKRFWERVKLWSEGENPQEWAAIGVGSIRDVVEDGRPITMVYVDDWIELPAYNLYRQHSISVALKDIKKIAERYNPLLFAHSHPSGAAEFSPADKALAFLVESEVVKRPMFHVVVTPKKEVKIAHFIHCWNCPFSIFKNFGRGGK